MKILLIYPEYENTFWNVKKVLEVLGKKAAYPPLGLLTIAAMLPTSWEKKLINMNCETLKKKHIKWADYVFISSIVGQKHSTREVVDRVRKIGKTVIAGGSLFTTAWEEFSNIDTIVMGESEEIIPVLIKDMENGNLKKIYSMKEFPAIQKTPVPAWDLIDLSRYNSVCIQISRGCPYNCEFCDVVQLNGRIPRIKSKDKIIAERNMGEKYVTTESSYPVLITVTKEINEPRLPSLMEILGAANKPINEWSADSLHKEIDLKVITLDLKGISMERKNIVYQDDIDDSVKKLVDSLAKEGVLR